MAASSLRVVSISRTCGIFFDDHRLVGEQSRSHARERGILRSTDADGAKQRVAAANYELIHVSNLLCFEPTILVQAIPVAPRE